MISDYGKAFDQSGPYGSLNSQLRVRLSMDLIKTADELWQDIQQGQISLDRKASLGEMTTNCLFSRLGGVDYQSSSRGRSNVFGVAGQVIGGVLETVKPGINVALPILKQAGEQAVKIASPVVSEVSKKAQETKLSSGIDTQPVISAAKVHEYYLPILKQAGEQAVKIASPVVSEVSKKAQETMLSSGIDTQPVISAAKTVADAAQQTTKVIDETKLITTSTVETISSADPVCTSVHHLSSHHDEQIKLIYVLHRDEHNKLLYFWYSSNSVLVSVTLSNDAFISLGDLTPAQSLDLMSTKNYVMIDIRSENDKNKAGVPRLPSNTKNKLISIPLEELPSKIRSLVRSVKKVEAEMVALKISHLKRIDFAKIVARSLTNLGFKNCWIVTDGFSGSKGWLQSRLGTDSYNLSFAEIISPSRIVPAAAKRFNQTASWRL
ncbi:calcium sensing receptor, chloroplastic [Olea europaea subsp. europaea]|uniref:Calcium sensing receptor, chloroplastic n=1 Tax=Olea europaea subsp. europaea TaxID=158383 RepID=A0A8S0STP3_OLEEU|nr:calcium sensing receptor, chloroplastic [Olea europaea subsp. europaea]